MNRRITLFGIVLAVLVIQSAIMGCLAGSSQKIPVIQSAGTVVHNTSSGGYYEIVAGDGTRYYPVNQDTYSFREGMYVYFEGDPANTTGSGDPNSIPIRISWMGEYVPPGSTAKITFTDRFSGAG